MIIDQKKTTLAYRCPHCGAVPTSMVGAFSLSGDLFKLKCSCGNSHRTLEKTNDDKLRLTVPCVVCPQPHTYMLSKNVFFNSDIFVIPCSLCGVDICFIGHERDVASAVVRSNEEILAALGDNSIDSLRQEKEENYTDPAVFDMITFVISDLADEGKISLDDKIADHFPDRIGEGIPPLIAEMTIRDMLMMSTCHKYSTYTGEDMDWLHTFFHPHHEPDHPAGTEFRYDTSATYTMDVLVERLTGKTFLEYLKDKALRELGFSEDAWCVEAPEGYAWGGSGVECTTRDLARFASIFMGGGGFGGGGGGFSGGSFGGGSFGGGGAGSRF